ncbi:MAG: Flp family type IVb pilin [Proteobacteria bacterium]|nr:Flp family type IVb pilin [Pseudomonadota bacterium]
MTTFFKRFAQDESGATAIEYGLIAALISITIITAATKIGGSVGAKFGEVESAVAPAS